MTPARGGRHRSTGRISAPGVRPQGQDRSRMPRRTRRTGRAGHRPCGTVAGASGRPVGPRTSSGAAGGKAAAVTGPSASGGPKPRSSAPRPSRASRATGRRGWTEPIGSRSEAVRAAAWVGYRRTGPARAAERPTVVDPRAFEDPSTGRRAGRRRWHGRGRRASGEATAAAARTERATVRCASPRQRPGARRGAGPGPVGGGPERGRREHGAGATPADRAPGRARLSPGAVRVRRSSVRPRRSTPAERATHSCVRCASAHRRGRDPRAARVVPLPVGAVPGAAAGARAFRRPHGLGRSASRAHGLRGLQRKYARVESLWDELSAASPVGRARDRRPHRARGLARGSWPPARAIARSNARAERRATPGRTSPSPLVHARRSLSSAAATSRARGECSTGAQARRRVRRRRGASRRAELTTGGPWRSCVSPSIVRIRSRSPAFGTRRCTGVAFAAAPDGTGAVCGPADGGMYLEFVHVSEGKTVKNRVHLGCASDVSDRGAKRSSGVCSRSVTIAWEGNSRPRSRAGTATSCCVTSRPTSSASTRAPFPRRRSCLTASLASPSLPSLPPSQKSRTGTPITGRTRWTKQSTKRR